MILINGSNSPLSYERPAPVFITEHRPLSTKKSRGTPKFAQPPRAPVKSCPVTRIFPRVNDTDRPQAVSFREDTDTSFIVQSPFYKAEKSALYFEQCYVIEERLGAGSFGEVFRVRSKEDGKLYACKRTLLKFRGEGDRRGEAWGVIWEQKIYKNKQYIIQPTNEHKSRQVKYVMSTPFDIQFINFITISQGPVHEAVEGDPKYLAPELMNLQFGPPADIFSLGMTILELATDLDLPKQGDAWQQLRQGRLPPAAYPYVMGLSKDLQSVLTGFLQPNPQERLTAEQALALPPIKRVLYHKTIKDYCRKSIMKAKNTLMQTWLYLVVFLSFLAQPLKCLQKSKASEDLPNLSRINNSDSDFTAGFSDDDGIDDQSLAQPLSDISTSSSEANQYTRKPFGNSTPIGYQFKKQTDFITVSPTIRNSLNASLNVGESPSFLHRRSVHSRSGRQFGQHVNVSGSLSVPCTPSPKIPVDEEPLSSFNLTSRNLMDLFNAAESDDDD
nr:membrane-associated tyrosine- and threonine-specific cdc2-inhibitory kinase-like [Cherax quadricarinatus]